MTAFALDSRLDADTVPILDLPLCSVRLSRDANYPWVVMVPRQPGLTEIIDLSPHDRGWLIEEIARVSAAVKTVTDCHKLNVGALGNAVPQLHVHVVARFRGDPAWPGAIWGKVPATAYTAAALAERVAALQAALARA